MARRNAALWHLVGPFQGIPPACVVRCAPTVDSTPAIDNIATAAIIPGVTPARAEVEALLPLPLATFHILLALADDDRHGYAILQEVERRTGGELRLSAGTLYRSIQRMLEDGLIVERRERPAPELDDERRRYYGLTALGSAVARAEAARLQSLIRMARAKGLAPERG
jgi:DNA-binding PadR family transcriptional regulator